MPLFLLSMLGAGKSAIGAVFSWLSRQSPATMLCLALALALAIDHVALIMAHRHTAKVETQLTKTIAARKADRDSYAQAQAAAQATNAAHVASIEAQQKRISDERLKSTNDRLARLAGELRAHGPAAQSHPNAAGSPALPDPAAGTPSPPGLCLSPAQLLRAAQDEERHDQLIDWLEQQVAIDPNKP